MFEQLFRHPAALRRHREGPLADERASYLASLASHGSAFEKARCARDIRSAVGRACFSEHFPCDSVMILFCRITRGPLKGTRR